MDELMRVVNVAACAVFAMAASWAVMSPEVQDGIVIKLGLISVALGFGATSWTLADGLGAGDLRALDRSLFLVHAGFMLMAAGYALRTRRGRRKRRRATDWMGLDSREVDGV